MSRYIDHQLNSCTLRLVVAPTKLVNAALNKRADQSGGDDEGNATNAVDGNTGTVFPSDTCSCTSKEVNPWWRVDLSRLYDVWHVTVTHVSNSKFADAFIGIASVKI